MLVRSEELFEVFVARKDLDHHKKKPLEVSSLQFKNIFQISRQTY